MRFLYIIGLFCFVTSCVTSETFVDRFSPEQIEYAEMKNAVRLKPDEQGLTKIQMGDIVGNNSFSMCEILDTMFVIPLETRDESVLGHILDIKFSKERIYVKDDNDQLMIFDLNGKYINKLKKGQGPGEIIRPYAFDYDENTQQLIVLQSWGFIFYDKNGQYIEEERHPFIALDFVSTKEGYIFFDYRYQNHHHDSNGSFAMFITDKSFKVRSKGINVIPDGLKNDICLYKTSLLSKLSDSFVVSQVCNDTIYEVNDGCFKAKYVIDFNNKIHITSKSDINDIYESTGFYYMGSMFEVEGMYQQFWFRNYKIGQCVVYRNVKTGKMVGGTMAYYDATEYPPYCFGTMTTYKDFFVSYIYPADNMKYSSVKLSDKSKQLLNKMSEEDNPVLVLYKVKF